MMARLGLYFLALGLVLVAPAAHAATDDTQITVSGVVWYDDDKNGELDANEAVAAGARVQAASIMVTSIKSWLTWHASVAADSNGRFTLSFVLGPSQRDPAVCVDALRPGYPYRWHGTGWRSNYSGCAPVPSKSEAAVEVNVPLHPDLGVLERLPEGAAPDFPIPGGRFFTQTNGYVGGSAVGFAVTNKDGIPFWDTWQRFGLDNIGYPLSHRFTWSGFVMQVFQKAVFQWQRERGLFFVNIYDELHNRKLDPWLRENRLTPVQLDPAFDAGKSWEQSVRDRLALLDASPAIKARYFAAPDPLLLYGLPTSRVEDYGALFVMRTQRTVIQLWKVDVPFARAGEITLSNGGEEIKDHAVFPADTAPPFPHLFIPQPPP